MESPVNVDFYRSILDKAQQDLNTGTTIQAKFLEDINGIKYADKETHDREMAKAVDMFKGALDSPFVSPSKLGQIAIKAGVGLSNWKNLNDKQLEQIKLQQEMKVRSGGSYVGNNVAAMSLTDENTGELVDPSKIQAIFGNGEDLQKMFLADNGHLASRTVKGKHNVYPIMGGQFIEFSDSTIKGLTPQEAANFGNPTVVKEYMQKLPDLAEAVKASGQNVEEYFSKNLSRIAGQLVQGTQENISHASNSNWQPSGYKPTGSSGQLNTFNPVLDPITKTDSNISELGKMLDAPEKDTLIQPKGISPYVQPQKIKGIPWATKQENFKKIADKYSTIWEKEKLKYLREGHGINPTTEEGKKDYRELQRSFENRLKELEKEGYAPRTVISFHDKDVDESLVNSVMIGTGLKSGSKVIGADGKEVPTSSVFKDGATNMGGMISNRGDVVVIGKDGKTYTVPISDKNGVPTGNVDKRTETVLGVIKKVNDGIFNSTETNLNKPFATYGIPIPTKYTDTETNKQVLATEELIFIAPDKGSDKNNVIKILRDTRTDQYIPGSEEPISYEDVILHGAQLIKLINPKR